MGRTSSKDQSSFCLSLLSRFDQRSQVKRASSTGGTTAGRVMHLWTGCGKKGMEIELGSPPNSCLEWARGFFNSPKKSNSAEDSALTSGDIDDI